MNGRRQLALSLHPRSSPIAKLAGFDEGNRRPAEIITANPEQFGGEHAGLVRWATAVLRRLAQKPHEHPHDSSVFEPFSAQFFEGDTA
jgi:hypothetical protein